MPCVCSSVWQADRWHLSARLLGRPGGAQDGSSSRSGRARPRSSLITSATSMAPERADRRLRQGGVVLAGGLRLGGPQADGDRPLLHGHRVGDRQRRSDNPGAGGGRGDGSAASSSWCPARAPFSAIHRRTCWKLARLGVTIMPAAPASITSRKALRIWWTSWWRADPRPPRHRAGADPTLGLRQAPRV